MALMSREEGWGAGAEWGMYDKIKSSSGMTQPTPNLHECQENRDAIAELAGKGLGAFFIVIGAFCF